MLWQLIWQAREAGYPTKDFSQVFELANVLGVPFTIHAGEAAGAENVAQALDLGAKRIGHGIRAAESEDVMQRLSVDRVALEMCPCSNLQTKAIKNLHDYPLRTFLIKGILATLNTDNMTVSQTYIQQEFRLLEADYQLKEEEAKKLLKNAIQVAFLNERDKQALQAYIMQRYAISL